MSEVTRYEPRNKLDEETGMNQMEEKSNGGWVTFEDFELATKARDGVFSQVVKSLTAERDQWEQQWIKANFAEVQLRIVNDEMGGEIRELLAVVEILADGKPINQMRYIRAVNSAKKRLEAFK